MIVSRASRLPYVSSLLGALDAITVAGSVVFVALLRFGWIGGLAYLHAHRVVLALIWATYPLTFYVFGMYEARRLQRARRTLTPAAGSVAVATLLVAGAFQTAFLVPLGRGVVVTFAIMVFLTTLILRLLYMEAVRSGFLRHRCLVIGTGEEAQRVLDVVEAHPSSRVHIVGVVECGSRRSHSRLREHDVLGSLEELEAIVSEHEIDRLILAGTPSDERTILRHVRQFRYRGVALVDFISLHEELAQEIPLDHVDDEWLFVAAMSNSRFHIHRVKRVMDFTIALALMIPVGLFVLPIAAICIKLTSRGPIFFRQERLGQGSRPFMLLKLRTMREDAEKLTGPVWSTENDPRITPVGRFLRKFRIDELPQLINVLRGDMSIIGPRPEREVFVRNLAQTLPYFEERLLVRPGITGWAQVMAPYAASVEDTRRKLQYDLYYIKNASFFLDLVIIAKTAKTMLFGRERAQGGIVTSAGESVTVLGRPEVVALSPPDSRKKVG